MDDPCEHTWLLSDEEETGDWEPGENLQIGLSGLCLSHCTTCAGNPGPSMTTDTNNSSSLWPKQRGSSDLPQATQDLSCAILRHEEVHLWPTMETRSHTLPKSTDKAHELSQFPVAIPTMMLFSNRTLGQKVKFRT